MARRVNQVQPVVFPVRRSIMQADSPRFDGDAALTLQIHVVQQLVFHRAGINRVAQLNQPVGQGGFSVVNVGDNRKITDVALLHRSFFSSALRMAEISRAARAAAAARAACVCSSSADRLPAAASSACAAHKCTAAVLSRSGGASA